MVLGIPDMSVAMAYLLMIAASLTCIIYGFRMWNKEGEISEKELAEEKQWAEEEKELEKDLADNGGSK